MNFPELTEIEGMLEAKQAEIAAIFAEATEGDTIDLRRVKSLGDGVDVAAKVNELNKELNDLGKKRDPLIAARKAAERNAAVEIGIEQPETETQGPKRTKSIGEQFVKSQAFKAWVRGTGPVVDLDVDLKTLFSTTAGWAPTVVPGPKVVPYATPLPMVTDLIPSTTTNQSAISYYEETTFTNAAAETAEGAAKPEAALALTLRTEAVRKIAVWIPLTDEAMEDETRVQQYIDNRLTFMVQQRLNTQILVGDGTAPNLSGILDRAGIQTQAKGADPTPDAVYKAMTKVRVTGMALPNGAVFHPNDWQDIRLLRTADGIYIWGSPSEAGPERIWGLPVVQEPGLTEGTGLVGDFTFSELAVRKGITVQVSDSHDVFFVANKLAVRAEMRAAFIVYRPAAFATVTGI